MSPERKEDGCSISTTTACPCSLSSSAGNPNPTSVTYQSPIAKNPDVRSAIEGVKYIAETMKSDEESNNVRHKHLQGYEY